MLFYAIETAERRIIVVRVIHGHMDVGDDDLAD
jgi:plasmid stabilization system protein ParE